MLRSDVVESLAFCFGGFADLPRPQKPDCVGYEDAQLKQAATDISNDARRFSRRNAPDDVQHAS